LAKIVRIDLARRPPIAEQFLETPVWNCRFTPDGRTLLANSDQLFQAFDAETGQPLGPVVEEPAGIYDLALAPDGETVLIGRHDGVAQLRNLRDGRATGRAMAHPDLITAVDFCPVTRGRTVLIGVRDGTAWLWDVPSGRPLGPPVVHGAPVDAVGFRPDGHSFVTVGTDGSARAWPVPQPIAGAVEPLGRLLEVETGLTLDESQGVATLGPEGWAQRRQGLDAPRAEFDPVGWDDARARDTEIAGNSSAALWHLDRLGAVRNAESATTPADEDWTLHARRGRAHSHAGRLDQAGAEYDRASERAPHEAILNWYLHRLVDCEQSRQWSVLLWYGKRARAIAPEDPDVHLAVAAAHDALGRPADRDAALVQALSHGADIAFLVSWASRLIRDGRGADAAGLVSRLWHGISARSELQIPAATVLLRAGDRAGYRGLCARAIARGTFSDPQAANNLAWLCAIGPDGLDDYTTPVRLAEQAVPRARDGRGRHAILNTLGAVLYCAGRWRGAVDRRREGITADGDDKVPEDWLFLAMAHQRLAHHDEAVRCLVRARSLDQQYQGASTLARTEFDLHRAEAEAVVLVDPTFPPDPFVP
jgi:tetratricopeptide (TPR) repeat protein